MNPKDTPPNPPSNVASLASRGIQPRFNELVQGCRKLVMNRLAEHLTGLFGQVDDTLFECAEKAENNRVQTLFFDNMRDIRRLRPQIERSYHQQIAQHLADFLEGKLKPLPQQQVDSEHLSLVQNDEYEESLQVTNMVSKVKARCAAMLFALDQRLALLNSGEKLVESSNPFGPQAIAQAFREALAPYPFPLRIKIILYMLFEQHVMENIDSLYEDLNKRLIEAGVLPNLKYSAVRRKDVSAAAPAASTQPARDASATAGFDGAGATAALPAESTALLNNLASLLDEHRRRDINAPLFGGTSSIANLAPRSASRTYSANDLLDALNRLQKQSAVDLAQRLQQPQKVLRLKVDLQQQLESHSALPGQNKFAEQEADIIDLVGMLFDFILNDDNLPDSCKTTLSHLHTPYLKVALQDKALFTQSRHPARRLLNAMAQAGVLYGGEGEERGLLAKMQWIVERVIQGFANDLNLFEQLLGEFGEYTATLKHRVELRERRAVEAAKGRDKLLSARQQAVAVVQMALRERKPPAIIRNFLELTWPDVLVFTLLRHGEQSPEWQRAAEVAEQLAWSGTPLDAEGRMRLQGMRVSLLEDMRKGLELLGGYHEQGVRRLLQDIAACQHAVQAQQPQLADRLNPPLPESPLGNMLGEDAALAASAATQESLSERAKALVKELEKLEFGAWFEFVEGSKVRTLKLSWFSPTTQNYMFVDQSGQRVAIKPIAQLAVEMEKGLARLLVPDRESPLMDRALGAIYRALRRFTGRGYKES
jgi:hypothetical protein